MNPRTPVITGVGQYLNRSKDLHDAIEPLAMMGRAAELAERDAGARLLSRIQSVRVVRGVWHYENPARALAEDLGSPDAQTLGTLFGGNQVQSVVNRTATEMLDGKLDLALITGAENGYRTAKARKAGVKLPERAAPGQYDVLVGSQKPEHHDHELARGIRTAIQVYPMYENAIRHHRRESMTEHLIRVSELWSRFNDVAQDNPNAWIRDNVSAEQIRTPSPTNRAISYPYTKMMNANMAVDMAAALIMCTVEKARSLGIAEDRWVYPHAGAEGYDHFSASVRYDFHSSPGVRLVGSKALALANTSINAMTYVDLYSCFPSAVQIAAAELGLDESRPLTVTGGLTFGGGPLNNYVMHSIARTVELLREDRGALALVTANGGNLYKHAHAVYGGEPSTEDFRCENVQDEIDRLPARECLPEYAGAATVESYAVMYSGDDPAIAHCACLTPEGKRFWVNCEDADVMQAMTCEEFCGKRVTVDGQGRPAFG